MDLSMVCSRIYLVCVYGDFVSVSRCECKCICNYFLCFKHVCIDMFFMYDNMFTLEFKRLCRYAITVDKLLSYPSKETLFPPPHSPPTPTFKQPLRFPLSLPLPLSFSLPLPLLSPFLSPPLLPPGPIILSMVLSFLGGRGNRPRWLAFGGFLAGVGTLAIFSAVLFYPPPTLSGEAAKFGRWGFAVEF